jgi:hypothetical protein
MAERKLLFLSFIILIMSLPIANAQKMSRKVYKKHKYWSFGGAINAMNYVGEVDPGPSLISPAFKFTKYNFSVCALYKIKPRLTLRGAVSYGRIKGDDFDNANYEEENIYRKMRNLNFRNQIYELKFDIIIDLFKYQGKYHKRPDYNPYFFTGLAYFYHNPEIQTPDGSWVYAKPLHTEGQGLAGGPKNYSLHQIALPIGLGIKYKLSRQFDLAFEVGWRFTLTDYLDDIGGKYYDKQALYDNFGETSALMSDRSYEAYSQNQTHADQINEHWSNQQVIYSPYPGHPEWKNIKGFGNHGDQRGDLKGRKDVYIITGFHLTYIIPERVVCPKFR